VLVILWCYLFKLFAVLQKGVFYGIPGTKRIVGLMDSSIYHRGIISMQTANDFAVIILTGMQQKMPLSSVKKNTADGNGPCQE